MYAAVFVQMSKCSYVILLKARMENILTLYNSSHKVCGTSSGKQKAQYICLRQDLQHPLIAELLFGFFLEASKRVMIE